MELSGSVSRVSSVRLFRLKPPSKYNHVARMAETVSVQKCDGEMFVYTGRIGGYIIESNLEENCS
jgi:hypothetical protein